MERFIFACPKCRSLELRTLDDGEKGYIWCVDCGKVKMEADSMHAVIEAWNKYALKGLSSIQSSLLMSMENERWYTGENLGIPFHVISALEKKGLLEFNTFEYDKQAENNRFRLPAAKEFILFRKRLVNV